MRNFCLFPEETKVSNTEDFCPFALFDGTSLAIFARPHCKEKGDFDNLGYRDGFGVAGGIGESNHKLEDLDGQSFLVLFCWVLVLVSLECLFEAEAYLSVYVVSWIREAN